MNLNPNEHLCSVGVLVGFKGLSYGAGHLGLIVWMLLKDSVCLGGWKKQPIVFSDALPRNEAVYLCCISQCSVQQHW